MKIELINENQYYRKKSIIYFNTFVLKWVTKNFIYKIFFNKTSISIKKIGKKNKRWFQEEHTKHKNIMFQECYYFNIQSLDSSHEYLIYLRLKSNVRDIKKFNT